MAETFSKLMKDLIFQFENVQQTPSRINRSEPYRDNTIENQR